MIQAFTGPEADLECHHSVATPVEGAHPSLDEGELTKLATCYHPECKLKAVEPLLRASLDPLPLLTPMLRCEDGRVVSAAATALGDLGDPRALEPLIAAIRSHQFMGRAARHGFALRTAFWSIVGCTVLLLLGPVLADWLSGQGMDARSWSRVSCTVTLFSCGVNLVTRYIRMTHVSRARLAALSSAICAIASGCGGRGLSETAYELELLGRDRLLQDPETCKVLRENARRLRDLDQGRSLLPIAATEPVPDLHRFPAPSGLRSDGRERGL